jgi:hypothetical protein
MVGNGHAMGVAAEIMQDILGAAAWTMSATSRGGRFIYFSSGGLSFSANESKGLAVALRCGVERCT